MSKIRDDNYYQISGWMLNKLGLKGTELQIFAIIYGFSQDGESMFSGSLSYLGDWVGASKPTVIKALKELVSKEYITKETLEVNQVIFNRYKVNLEVVENLRGSKDSLQGSKDSLLNNNQYNNTNTVSKDTVLDTGSTQNTPKPAQSSGKLFSSAKSQTRKSAVQKTNAFITSCMREAAKKEFRSDVMVQLEKYFIMLAEMNALLPSVSIAEQLACLAKVSVDRQVAAVKYTISRGWKSLQYASEEMLESTVPSWDTAAPDAFKAKTEEEKSRDWRKEVSEEEVF